MALRSPRWNTIARLRSASENLPPMRIGEFNHDATVVLQEALIENGFSIPAGPTGNYLQETAAAVRAAEDQFGLTVDGGVAGRQVLSALDGAFIGGVQATFGAALARGDAPFALSKVQAAIDALTLIGLPLVQSDGTRGTIPETTADALKIHFRLVNVLATIGVARLVTDDDIRFLLNTFNAIARVLRNSNTTFRDGVPLNGIGFAAESPFGGPITFGPAFRSVTLPDGALIGPNSRAAILIHESTHVIDGSSGDFAIHISEFAPEYDTQPADLSIHNPSSYAGFAANVFPPPGEPNPRFGLGPGQAL
jgi:peptidoglycan hydrolase-like protein with peptidoglycan-binding domain